MVYYKMVHIYVQVVVLDNLIMDKWISANHATSTHIWLTKLVILSVVLQLELLGLSPALFTESIASNGNFPFSVDGFYYISGQCSMCGDPLARTCADTGITTTW